MKTTKKHFEIFKKECEYWIEKFKLDNWTFVYEWRDISKHGVDGACNQGGLNYVAHISLDTDIDDENISKEISIEQEIKNCAKHEITHILIKRMKLLAIQRYVREEEIEDEEESLVRKLEKLL